MKALGLCLLSFAVGFALGACLGWWLWGMSHP
jgi:hypothetical protein